MKFKIGIFGPAEGYTKSQTSRIQDLVEELAKHNVILVTGAGAGLPYAISQQAAKEGIEIWGFPPTTDLKEYKKLYPEYNLKIYKKLTYIPKNYQFANNVEVCRSYRNVTSCATCDAGIIIASRWGTLNEFTNLHGMGKVIGVLTKTGGIADELQKLSQKIVKKSKAKLIFNSSPKILVKNLISNLKNLDE